MHILNSMLNTKSIYSHTLVALFESTSGIRRFGKRDDGRALALVACLIHQYVSICYASVDLDSVLLLLW